MRAGPNKLLKAGNNQVRISKPRAFERLGQIPYKGTWIAAKCPILLERVSPEYLSLPIRARLVMGSCRLCQGWRRRCPGPASSLAETAEFRRREGNPWTTHLLLSSCLYPRPWWGPSPRSNHDVPLERKGIWSSSAYGGKGKMLSSRGLAWNPSREGLHWWAKLVYWREGSRWTLYPSPQHHTALFAPVPH